MLLRFKENGPSAAVDVVADGNCSLGCRKIILAVVDAMGLLLNEDDFGENKLKSFFSKFLKSELSNCVSLQSENQHNCGNLTLRYV